MSKLPNSPEDKELAQIRKQASTVRFVAESTGLLDAAEQFGRKLAGLSYDRSALDLLKNAGGGAANIRIPTPNSTGSIGYGKALTGGVNSAVGPLGTALIGKAAPAINTGLAAAGKAVSKIPGADALTGAVQDFGIGTGMYDYHPQEPAK